MHYCTVGTPQVPPGSQQPLQAKVFFLASCSCRAFLNSVGSGYRGSGASHRLLLLFHSSNPQLPFLNLAKTSSERPLTPFSSGYRNPRTASHSPEAIPRHPPRDTARVVWPQL